MGAGYHGGAFISRAVAKDPLARWATALLGNLLVGYRARSRHL